jgi:hypothetical protein
VSTLAALAKAETAALEVYRARQPLPAFIMNIQTGVNWRIWTKFRNFPVCYHETQAVSGKKRSQLAFRGEFGQKHVPTVYRAVIR